MSIESALLRPVQMSCGLLSDGAETVGTLMIETSTGDEYMFAVNLETAERLRQAADMIMAELDPAKPN